MFKSPDAQERVELAAIEENTPNSYQNTRLQAVKRVTRWSPPGSTRRFSVNETPVFQAIAAKIPGEHGRQIRALLFLQSRLLRDILKHDLNDDPEYVESGRAVLDSNCHQTALKIMGQINFWGRMQAAKILNKDEETNPVALFGIPKNDEDFRNYEIFNEAELAYQNGNLPVQIYFEAGNHSAILIQPQDADFLAFEQNGFNGELRFKLLSEITAERGPATFLTRKNTDS